MLHLDIKFYWVSKQLIISFYDFFNLKRINYFHFNLLTVIAPQNLQLQGISCRPVLQGGINLRLTVKRLLIEHVYKISFNGFLLYVLSISSVELPRLLSSSNLTYHPRARMN